MVRLTEDEKKDADRRVSHLAGDGAVLDFVMMAYRLRIEVVGVGGSIPLVLLTYEEWQALVSWADRMWKERGYPKVLEASDGKEGDGGHKEL